MADFPTYKEVVDEFNAACTAHLAINQFGEGSIDRFDSLFQNAKYPFAFLRPLQSQGMVLNTNGVSGQRSLNFELIMSDVPKLTDEDTLKIQSNCEIYIYDIISWFNLGSNQREWFCTLNSISPLYESFNDRVAGWVANITISTYGVLDYCNFPKL